MENADSKTYDVDKEIRRCGLYRPLCFKENGKIIKLDYDRDEYCEILREEARDMYSVESKADFEFSFAQSALGLLDNEEYNQKLEKYTDEELDIEKERLRKKIYRIHNRILEGKEGSANIVASDKTCYHFLERIEKHTKKSLLTPIVDDKPFYYENKYLYSLTIQLIEIMYASDVFNYVPNSNNFQRICYRNHLFMIEENIKEIFGCESDTYTKWLEILAPFQQLIYESSYPGIRNGDIWHCKCEELRFFDCSYEIAKNFELYSRVKSKLKFDLGSTRAEVNCELRACKLFFSKNKQTEKELFCEKMLCTLKKIVYEEFGLEV